jgi:hypothetical protein
MHIVAADKLDLQVQSRDEDGPFAALEWLIPTAVIVYIGKSYFDEFLKEMGKDHYALLKVGLKTLHGKLVGPHVPNVTSISTEGKVRADQIYSLRYSILAEAGEGLRFKLLIQANVSSHEYDEVLASFLAFLEAYHGGALDSPSVERVKHARVLGGTVLLAFDHGFNVVVPVDPIPRRPAD